MSKQKSVTAENVSDFVHRITTGGQSAMYSSFNALRKQERHVFQFIANSDKNRFSNVVLFNEGAVNLKVTHKGESSYIHATKIKSKYGNYILAQGPLPDTVMDWYRMIWQYHINVIVCLVPFDRPEDCAQYFESKKGNKIKKGRFSMKTFAVRQENEMEMYELRLRNADAKENKERAVHVVHYRYWQLQRPIDPRELLLIIRSTWALEESMQSITDNKVNITLVHGSSGVRRTGTYVVTAMLCKQIREKGVVSIVTAISSVRKYRYGVMRNKLMFATLLESILHFSADQGLIDRKHVNFAQTIKIIREALLTRPKEETEEDESDNSDENK